MNKVFDINKEIESAYTLPADFYRSPEVFEILKDKVFARSWQFITETDTLKLPEDVYPFDFIKGYVEEPLLFTRDNKDELHCLSNVCTHRGNLLVKNPGTYKAITCAYHGRRFELNGCFKSMPECEGMKNFPADSDHLPKVPFGDWAKFLFVSLLPAFPLSELIREMNQRLYFLPFQDFIFEPSRSQDYLVKANWALYCDNYLEGFHIPFVHKDLFKSLDYSAYSYEIYRYSNLQLGIGKSGDVLFELPEGHLDFGKKIAAYYYWLFPNMMFNFYPWGLSINIVSPVSVNLSRISYRTYIWDNSKLDTGAGGAIDKVEREDQNIVESVQKGISSRLYKRGRFSPKMEKGVHHFHSLIAEMMK